MLSLISIPIRDIDNSKLYMIRNKVKTELI